MARNPIFRTNRISHCVQKKGHYPSLLSTTDTRSETDKAFRAFIIRHTTQALIDILL
jgi:hypothetical protein